jgi:hypothetical protein
MSTINPKAAVHTSPEDRRRASLAAAEFAEPAVPAAPVHDALDAALPANCASLPMRRLAAGEFGDW